MDREALKRELRRDEGYRSKPYVDTVGKVTIGVGRNLTDEGLSDKEINYLLENDIDEVQQQLEDSLIWFEDLDEVRQRVLMNMCFNMGITKFMKFKRTLEAVRRKQYADAADYMLESLWAQQVGQRAKRLANMMRTGKV